MAAKKAEPVDFEHSLQELEQLVEKLEQGDLKLEEALQQFERGIRLVQSCQSALQTAERRVEQLLETDRGTVDIVPFSDND
jgi:exodeoxyribonuclease VII small subunit